MPRKWKKGRGKLGAFAPLLGSWLAEGDSPLGPVRCQRTLTPILATRFLRLEARWHIGKGASSRRYEELAIIGVDAEGDVRFWSFTSDGKRSEGTIADVSDLHAEAVGFEADMPAGRARVAYWPAETEGFHWAVEHRTKIGWRRFVEHTYRPA